MYNDEGVIAGFLGYDDAIRRAESLLRVLLVTGAIMVPWPILIDL